MSVVRAVFGLLWLAWALICAVLYVATGLAVIVVPLWIFSAIVRA